MEGRLSAALQTVGREVRIEAPASLAAPVAPAEETGEAVAPALENGANVWPDESAEGAFLSEARERGEPVMAAVAVEAVEETDTKSLPPLDELVKRLSPEVRETLDELFRAKFIAVRRIPKKALKT